MRCAAPRGEAELDAVQFLKLARAETKRLAMPDAMLKRNVNVGFSGGEKKRNEVLQMALLRPKLAILDETDSGLDIDALKIVADGVNALRGPDFAALVITHHQRSAGPSGTQPRTCAGGRPHRSHRRTGAGQGIGKERLRQPDRGGCVSTAVHTAPLVSWHATKTSPDGCRVTRPCVRPPRRRSALPACRVAPSSAGWRPGNTPACGRSPKPVFSPTARRGTRPRRFWPACRRWMRRVWFSSMEACVPTCR